MTEGDLHTSISKPSLCNHWRWSTSVHSFTSPLRGSRTYADMLSSEILSPSTRNMTQFSLPNNAKPVCCQHKNGYHSELHDSGTSHMAWGSHCQGCLYLGKILLEQRSCGGLTVVCEHLQADGRGATCLCTVRAWILCRPGGGHLTAE